MLVCDVYQNVITLVFVVPWNSHPSNIVLQFTKTSIKPRIKVNRGCVSQLIANTTNFNVIFQRELLQIIKNRLSGGFAYMLYVIVGHPTTVVIP